jgi:hypothetical protein
VLAGPAAGRDVSSNTSTPNCRFCVICSEFITRIRPIGVVCQTESSGVTTFLRSSTPGVQIRPHSERSPNSSGRSIGPLRPCWIRPRNIHVHLAFMTSATAFSAYGLKCRCTESVCTKTRSPCFQS